MSLEKILGQTYLSEQQATAKRTHLNQVESEIVEVRKEINNQEFKIEAAQEELQNHEILLGERNVELTAEEYKKQALEKQLQDLTAQRKQLQDEKESARAALNSLAEEFCIKTLELRQRLLQLNKDDTLDYLDAIRNQPEMLKIEEEKIQLTNELEELMQRCARRDEENAVLERKAADKKAILERKKLQRVSLHNKWVAAERKKEKAEKALEKDPNYLRLLEEVQSLQSR